ncbi:hypothetical protein [uncultured Tenacibaculum sp.]|uniref:hypothetical protein n=1 Tax=uncultured Tenacibaculum sp. TaxID=174713 RepID=UPI0026022C93|nr:hypothetical protein [uncultured Tenacibaculum sp.]
MNAQVVYQVAKALPKEEQIALYEMLQKELSVNSLEITKKKHLVLTKEAAIQYLLKNVFNKK